MAWRRRWLLESQPPACAPVVQPLMPPGARSSPATRCPPRSGPGGRVGSPPFWSPTPGAGRALRAPAAAPLRWRPGPGCCATARCRGTHAWWPGCGASCGPMASPRAPLSSTTPTPRARNRPRRAPSLLHGAIKHVAALSGGTAWVVSYWCPRPSLCPWAVSSLSPRLRSVRGRERQRPSRSRVAPPNSGRANRLPPCLLPPKHHAPGACLSPARPHSPLSGCTLSGRRRSRARRRWSLAPRPFVVAYTCSRTAAALRPCGSARVTSTAPTPVPPIPGRPPPSASAAAMRWRRGWGVPGCRAAPTHPHGASSPAHRQRKHPSALCSPPTCVGGRWLWSRARHGVGLSRCVCRTGRRRKAGAR